jgi:hypothetical protein
MLGVLPSAVKGSEFFEIESPWGGAAARSQERTP